MGGFPDGLWEWRYKKTTLKCSYEAGVVEGACMMLVDGRMTEWGQRRFVPPGWSRCCKASVIRLRIAAISARMSSHCR